MLKFSIALVVVASCFLSVSVPSTARADMITDKTRTALLVQMQRTAASFKNGVRSTAAVSMAAAHADETRNGVDDKDVENCIAGIGPDCQAVFRQMMGNLQRIISVSYKVAQSMSLFDASRAQYSMSTAQLMLALTK